MTGVSPVSLNAMSPAARPATTGSASGPVPLATSLREAAEQMVAQAFVLPLLEQMRKDPFRSDLFHGGQGEDLFRSQWNQIIADRLTQKADFPLVETLHRYLSRTPAQIQEGRNGSVDRTA